MVPGTVQSETPVPPKVGFETRDQSGREWPINRLYGMSEKCIRHKPQKRGENSTHWKSTSYVISNA